MNSEAVTTRRLPIEARARVVDRAWPEVDVLARPIALPDILEALVTPPRTVLPRPRFSWVDTSARVRAEVELPSLSSRFVVRTFDLAGAVLGLVIALPIMLFVALAVRVTTHGPAFFVHWRVGRSGRLFPCLKFRSMWPDAEKRLADLLLDPVLKAEWQAAQKLRDDPRVTPIGAFLRRTNLDEIPQLLNVLMGDMSIVGPRPVTPAETERYGGRLSTVLSVKPGLTGLWQVSGRSEVSYMRRVELDVEYVKRRSILLDLGICLRTVWTTVHPHHHGAF